MPAGITKKDNMMSDWPAGMSDGLDLPCGDCDGKPRFDYRVTEEFWKQWVPEDDKRLGVICLPCLDRRCKGEGLMEALVFIQWLGTSHTVELIPARSLRYEARDGEPSRPLASVNAPSLDESSSRFPADANNEEQSEEAQDRP